MFKQKPSDHHHHDSDQALQWDLIADEILPKLHPNTLARCKCVSKLWNSHISSPSFVPQLSPIFRCYTVSTGGALTEFHAALRGGRRFERLPLGPWAPRHPSHFVWPLGSCNGVVCLGADCLLDPKRMSPILVWSPSSSVKPSSVTFYRDRHYTGSASGVCLGFGWTGPHHHRGGDYKAVQITYQGCREMRPFTVYGHVYSVKAQAWRYDVGGDHLLPEDVVEISWISPQNSSDGTKIYWLAKRAGQRNLVVSFDFIVESFGHVALPERLEQVGRGEKVRLATLAAGNWLTVLKYGERANGGGGGEWCEVWARREECNGWEEIARIGLDVLDRPLGFVNMYEFLIHRRGSVGEIVSYDVRTKERVCLRIPGAVVFSCVASNYVDSKVEL